MKMRLEEHQNLPPPKPPASGSALPVNPEHWVEKYGDVLFGFATSRVRDRTIAQDLVQETFLGRALLVAPANEPGYLASCGTN